MNWLKQQRQDIQVKELLLVSLPSLSLRRLVSQSCRQDCRIILFLIAPLKDRVAANETYSVVIRSDTRVVVDELLFNSRVAMSFVSCRFHLRKCALQKCSRNAQAISIEAANRCRAIDS
eukprot:4921658-Amphidinium_carterae.1